MGVDGSELLGLATYAAIAAARAAATNQAAKAEGITYEEMRLRENAARYRAGSNSRWTARGRCKAAARAAACDEQLARFEETRIKQMSQAGDNSRPLTTQSNNDQLRFCIQCGAQNGVQSKFCNECGTQCQEGRYATATVSAYNPNYKPDEKINYATVSAYNPNYTQ